MIIGERRSGNTFKVMEKMHGTQEHFEYVITLFARENRIEMQRTEDDVAMIPAIPIKLRLKAKCIPPHLFEEICWWSG